MLARIIKESKNEMRAKKSKKIWSIINLEVQKYDKALDDILANAYFDIMLEKN
jgi:hypothetical protein